MTTDACLTMSDYQLARHWVEVSEELEQRRAQRKELIDSVVARAELDHRQAAIANRP